MSNIMLVKLQEKHFEKLLNLNLKTEVILKKWFRAVGMIIIT